MKFFSQSTFKELTHKTVLHHRRGGGCGGGGCCQVHHGSCDYNDQGLGPVFLSDLYYIFCFIAFLVIVFSEESQQNCDLEPPFYDCLSLFSLSLSLSMAYCITPAGSSTAQRPATQTTSVRSSCWLAAAAASDSAANRPTDRIMKPKSPFYPP